MRISMMTFFLALSFEVRALECPEHSPSEDTLETHIAAATEVALGRVVGGRVNEAARVNETVMTVKVLHAFKGTLPSEVELTTGQEQLIVRSGLELGAWYIFFLYGARTIDACSLIISAPANSNSLRELAKDLELREKSFPVASRDPDFDRARRVIELFRDGP